MRVFYYSADEAGLSGEYPPGLMRLVEGDGVAETVTDPALADLFIVPAIMRHIGPERVSRLPYLAGNERRHLLWNLAEDVTVDYPCGPLYLRADATKALVARCNTVRAWPWPVVDLYAGQPEKFTLDVCFQGWASTELTNTVCDSVRRQPGLASHIQTHDFFYGYHDSDPAYAHYRQSFIDTLRASRLSLVPRSIPAGVVRYRFYEAMSAGRVPVHFCDGRVLPFADRIDYSACSIHIAEARAADAGEIIKWWLGRHDDNKIREMGEYGRRAWRMWLDRSRWDTLFSIVAREWLAQNA